MSFRRPAGSTSAQIDPEHTGSIVRRAFLLEAVLNLFTIPLVTNTRTALSILLARPAQINPASVLFARLFGGLVVGGLTPLLIHGYRNTVSGIESRLHEAVKGGGPDAALTVGGAVGPILCLAPPLMWRVYVLFVSPELVGRYREGGSKAE
ncbi:hypothetical protein EHS25_007605 [Saitozyma podzolica]|uniref:Uncharacterized protein n=1 Tax=Saitozyma podzolica TaxID=1890683 RepID=A0A427YQ83_9TREE|nr:hypothetical protein EHS25_007605 [Saitozyma podzolica]